MYALFWLLLIGLFGVLWCGSLVVMLAGKARQSKTLIICGKVPFVIVTCVGAWCAFSFVQSYIYTLSPRNVYSMTFGFEPTPDVVDMKSALDGIGDNAETYLRFRAPPQTIRRIIGIGLKPASREKAESQGLLDRTGIPAWWKPKVSKSTQFYVAEHRVDAFSSEDEVLCYDTQTQMAYYQYVGID